LLAANNKNLGADTRAGTHRSIFYHPAADLRHSSVPWFQESFVSQMPTVSARFRAGMGHLLAHRTETGKRHAEDT
jgi:hypothetical protein